MKRESMKMRGKARTINEKKVKGKQSPVNEQSPCD